MKREEPPAGAWLNASKFSMGSSRVSNTPFFSFLSLCPVRCECDSIRGLRRHVGPIHLENVYCSLVNFCDGFVAFEGGSETDASWMEIMGDLEMPDIATLGSFLRPVLISSTRFVFFGLLLPNIFSLLYFYEFSRYLLIFSFLT